MGGKKTGYRLPTFLDVAYLAVVQPWSLPYMDLCVEIFYMQFPQHSCSNKMAQWFLNSVIDTNRERWVSMRNEIKEMWHTVVERIRYGKMIESCVWRGMTNRGKCHSFSSDLYLYDHLIFLSFHRIQNDEWLDGVSSLMRFLFLRILKKSSFPVIKYIFLSQCQNDKKSHFPV